MPFSLSDSYDRLILGSPRLTLLVIALITSFFIYFAGDFRLDASADSLVLENDQALEYYRSIKARYGSDDYLIITYTPKGDLFSKTGAQRPASTEGRTGKMARIASVIPILDVPLIQSPPITFGELGITYQYTG